MITIRKMNKKRIGLSVKNTHLNAYARIDGSNLGIEEGEEMLGQVRHL